MNLIDKAQTAPLTVTHVRIPDDELDALIQGRPAARTAPLVQRHKDFDRSELTGRYLVARDNLGMITMDRVVNHQLVERRQFQDPGLEAKPPLLERLKRKAKALTGALGDQVTILRSCALR